MSETTPEDEQEQQASPARDAAVAADPTVPVEAPEADVVEQSIAAGPGEHGHPLAASRELPLEADPADAAEQAVVVELDEDERR